MRTLREEIQLPVWSRLALPEHPQARGDIVAEAPHEPPQVGLRIEGIHFRENREIHGEGQRRGGVGRVRGVVGGMGRAPPQGGQVVTLAR